jgi:hypothetical protein
VTGRLPSRERGGAASTRRRTIVNNRRERPDNKLIQRRFPRCHWRFEPYRRSQFARIKKGSAAAAAAAGLFANLPATRLPLAAQICDTSVTLECQSGEKQSGP